MCSPRTYVEDPKRADLVTVNTGVLRVYYKPHHIQPIAWFKEMINTLD